MGALSLSCSPVILLRCILRHPPPSTTTTYFLKLINHHHHHHPVSLSSISPPTPSLFPITPRCFSTDQDLETDDSVTTPAEKEIENPVILNAHKEMMSKLKDMSVKEKKELGSYANSLGKKLKSQQVGKSGVTDSVATALIETLEANELLKVFCFSSFKIGDKVHTPCSLNKYLVFLVLISKF